MEILGIDVGGSGIKGAPVDTERGVLLAQRYRLPTPKPSTPESAARTIVAIVRHFKWKGAVGCGFPGVVRRGMVMTAANLSKKWIGVQANVLLAEASGCDFKLANDADAAGLAEIRFGAGQGREGVVLMITLGTGIGTALFKDGKLFPNVELGHLELDGKEAEKWASEKVRRDKALSWKKWAKRVNTYLDRMHTFFWPDLIILGGGGSKNFEKFAPYLSTPCDVVPAKLRNSAGIVGAALASELLC